MGKKKPVYTAYLQVVKNRVTTFGENAETKEALTVLKMYGIRTDTMKVKGELKESDTAIMVRIALNLDDATEDWTINGSPISEIAYGNVLRYWPLSIVDMNKSGQKIKIQYPDFDIDCEVVYTINATDDQVLGEPETTNESTQKKEDNTMGENMENTETQAQVQGAETEAVETEAKAKKKLPKWAVFTLVGAGIATVIGAVSGILLSKKAKAEADEAPVEA